MPELPTRNERLETPRPTRRQTLAALAGSAAVFASFGSRRFRFAHAKAEDGAPSAPARATFEVVNGATPQDTRRGCR